MTTAGDPPPWLRRETYTPERKREDVRTAVTVALLGIFALVVVVLLVSTCIIWIRAEDKVAVLSDVKEIVGLLVNPIVALLGSAIGFYFGSRQREENDARANR